MMTSENQAVLYCSYNKQSHSAELIGPSWFHHSVLCLFLLLPASHDGVRQKCHNEQIKRFLTIFIMSSLFF